ncbi:MAG: hypothetical protein IT285_04190 [Bdellovibrionales bacterium]|nr:hypothetical protein [Bdellovibrionales bacterium]
MELGKIKELVRASRLAEAREALEGLRAGRKLRRRDLASAARLAMMALSPELALRILSPAVRGRGRAPTEREKVEYAIALSASGADAEALKLLSGVNATQEPRVFRPVAFIHFKRWSWSEAIPVIEQALAAPRLVGGPRVVARLFRETARLHGEGDAAGAAPRLESLAIEARASGFPMLALDGLFLAAQAFHLAGDSTGFAKAARRVDEHFETIGRREFGLGWECWKRFEALRLAKGHRAETAAIRAELLELRRRLRADLPHSARVLRSVEFYEGRLAGDSELLSRVYFGSPYPALRARIEAIPGWTPPPEWEQRIGQGPERGEPAALDLRGPARLGSSGVDAVLRALFADLYGEPGVVELHERLFPGEYYNPGSSPKRVRQALVRTAQWCRKKGVPLAWAWRKGKLQVGAARPLRIRLPDPGVSLGPRPGIEAVQRIEGLRAKVSSRDFSAEEAAGFLKVSLSTATRLLRLAAEAGGLSRSGSRRGTRYRFREG